MTLHGSLARVTWIWNWNESALTQGSSDYKASRHDEVPALIERLILIEEAFEDLARSYLVYVIDFVSIAVYLTSRHTKASKGVVVIMFSPKHNRARFAHRSATIMISA